MQKIGDIGDVEYAEPANDGVIHLVSSFETMKEDDEAKALRVIGVSGPISNMEIGSGESLIVESRIVDARKEGQGGTVSLSAESLGGIKVYAGSKAFDVLSSADVSDYFAFPDPPIREKKFGFIPVSVQFERDPDAPSWVGDVYLPLIRIHRPQAAGCSTTAVSQLAEGASIQGKFGFTGLGAGGSLKFRSALRRTYVANDACVEVAVRSKVQVQHGWVNVNGNAVYYVARYLLMPPDSRSQYIRDIPARADRCRGPYPEDIEIVDMTETSPHNLYKAQSKISSSSFGYISAGVELNKVPVSLSLKMTRELAVEYSVETTLAGGATYSRFNLVGVDGSLIETCWQNLGAGPRGCREVSH
ncbi:hypothetical protein ORV05_30495 [Amycolatopsis cynarae]|uniref:Uncharacterized protein n=1 Tax=Amycolatopsis cynarae TaxID=2995223 RepID=A0ABY7AZS3_9PSEU|nr:hypothetical protein [Amycolatopsis sp. HUAS 11-8]WAL65195.1 hypothetical protein ORV05_30495 [Amycolatopsis sp. HUAS 11-8]